MAAILAALEQFAAGNLAACPAPVGLGDLPDQLIERLQGLATVLEARFAVIDAYERQLGAVVDVISSMAAMDFSRKAPVNGNNSMLDALSFGLNMLGEELEAALRKQAQATARLHESQEQTIRAQAAALAELSTPLIPISDHVVIMPLIGNIDARRAQQVLESLLVGVAKNAADVVILDITGVSMVDTQVANALLQAAQAVQLLGARVILTGIRPEVAQTLVGLGVNLEGIITRSTLQSGIAAAIRTHSGE